MPRKKEAVRRGVERLAQQAKNPKEALDVLKAVTAEVDKQAESAGLHEGEIGTLRNGNKITPSYADLCKQFPIVSFTPEETIGLGFQGVRVQALAGIEMHVPKCFKDIYDNHRRSVTNSRKLNNELAQFGINVESGAGGIL